MPQLYPPSDFANPAGWPEAILPVLFKCITCEFASFTAQNVPIAQPLLPFMGKDGRTIDATTGLTYPAKAERARRNPRVGLLFSDFTGSGLSNPPVVLIYGSAAVRDADLQLNTDRYVRLTMARNLNVPLPRFALRRMQWYLARIWIEITPQRILWWPKGNIDRDPNVWQAPADLVLPESDPAPAGKQPPRWKNAPSDWRRRAEYAYRRLGTPVLTLTDTVDQTRYPIPFRVSTITPHAEGFRVRLAAGTPAYCSGSACLTFHWHPDKFTGQENMTFLGIYTPDRPDGMEGIVRVDRCPGDWSLPPRGMSAAFAFLGNGLKLMPRLKAEARRRGQSVPKVNFPN